MGCARVLAALLAAALLSGASVAAELGDGPHPGETLAPGCPGTIQWDGGGGSTAWTTLVNWSPNVMPEGSDDVCIPDLAEGVEVVHATGTHAVHSLAGTGGLQVSGGTLTFAVGSPGLRQLTLSGGTLSGVGDLPVLGPFSWTGGVLSGLGLTAATDAALAGANGKGLTGGRVLETSGTTMWSGTGQIRLGTGAGILNTGTWDVQTNATLANLGTAGGFQNPAGSTFKKSAGGGTTGLAVSFDNGGAVSIQSGILELSGGSSSTGTFQGSTGTGLYFTGGAHALASGGSLAVPTVVVSAGSLTVDGDYSASTSIFSGGSVTFRPAATLTQLGALSIAGTADVDLSSGEALTVPAFSLLGGVLRGTDNLEITELDNGLVWSAGEMTGAGTTKGTISLTGSAAKDLTGGRLLKLTGGTWEGAGTLRLGGGATVENADWLSIDNANATLLDLGGATGVLNLSGGLWYENSGGVHVVQVPFTNAGVARLAWGGTLSLEGGGSATGRFDTSTNPTQETLRFGGRTFALTSTSYLDLPIVAVTAGAVTVEGTYRAGSTRVSGGALAFHPPVNLTALGEVVVSGTGILSLAAGTVVPATKLTLSGGTLAGSDALSVLGPATWSGGAMTGHALTRTAGGLSGTGAAAHDLTAGRMLQTAGVTSWSGTGPLRLGAGAAIQNVGEWDLESGATLEDLGGGGPFLNEPGAVFRKVEDTGTSSVGVPFVNGGTVHAGVGALQFSEGYRQTAGATWLDGGSLASSTPLWIEGGSLGGVGTIAASVISSGTVAPGLAAGRLTLDGSYTQGYGGTLAIEIGGLVPASQYDWLEVTGTASLSAGLDVALIDGFEPGDGDGFAVLTAAEIEGSFGALHLPPLPAGLGWVVEVQPTAVVLRVSPDLDGDGVGDAGDCAPSDPTAGYAPFEVAGVAFGADKQTLSWVSQAATAGSGTVYDVVRGLTLPVGGAGETCIASGISPAQVTDVGEPSQGSCFYYVVRARNTCGVGPFGTETGGSPRTTTACP